MRPVYHVSQTKLHYKNIGGMLVREDGYLRWRCPNCQRTGRSREVLPRHPGACKTKT